MDLKDNGYRPKYGMCKNDNDANALAAQPDHQLDLTVSPRDSVHFVTTLNSGYLPGLVRLLESLEENSKLDNWDIRIIPMDDEVKQFRHPRLRSFVGLDAERNSLRIRTTNARFAPNFYKLCVHALPTDEVLHFIDVDMLCVGDLNQLRQWYPDITAVRNFAICEKTKRENSAYRVCNLPIFNSGLFCFQPSESTFRALSGYINSRNPNVKLGDQEIFNDFYQLRCPERIKYASYAYNYRSHLTGGFLNPRSPTGGKPFPEEPKILHYIHATKPWHGGEGKMDQQDMFHLWRKEISLEEYLKRDKTKRGVK